MLKNRDFRVRVRFCSN